MCEKTGLIHLRLTAKRRDTLAFLFGARLDGVTATHVMLASCDNVTRRGAAPTPPNWKALIAASALPCKITAKAEELQESASRHEGAHRAGREEDYLPRPIKELLRATRARRATRAPTELAENKTIYHGLSRSSSALRERVAPRGRPLSLSSCTLLLMAGRPRCDDGKNGCAKGNKAQH